MDYHYKELKDLLDRQIKKILEKGDITPQELDNLYKASAIVLDVETRKAMHKAEEEMDHDNNYSRRGSYEMSDMGHSGHYPYHIFYDGSYGRSYDGRRGMDGDNDGRYSEGMSYDNGSYRGYMRRNSRAAEKDHMIEQLEEMMANAPDERSKKAIMRCIDKLDD